MATVSVRVPDELKARMEEYEEVNWSAIIRERLEESLAEIERESVASAVATSERLSRGTDADAVEERDSAELIREFRERRYGDR